MNQLISIMTIYVSQLSSLLVRDHLVFIEFVDNKEKYMADCFGHAKHKSSCVSDWHLSFDTK